ncbi:MAG: glycosyltransferase family 1 protein [Deltaproteobacteria bacterium]|nr:glycosyltransferase family 1 protein [Deltaproteobacteria bacterium]
MVATRFSVEVQSVIPERLARLEDVANDIFYSWDHAVRRLFYRLDPNLWQSVGHSPKLFLRRISQERLEEAADDRVYMVDYSRVLSVYDAYVYNISHKEKRKSGSGKNLKPGNELVAYFCAEFGFHESIPLYSGGLGILAGDHCKAASDLGIPFVAVGLLYRQGYFNQTIDEHGNQVAHYHPTNFANLPISPACDQEGNELRIAVEIADRTVQLKVWEMRAGHIRLYLMDCDLPENSEEDRRITYQLYGGDINTRIQQEIVLGIGGVRAIRALGLNPTAWHINEGHAAFQILERCREKVEEGVDFHTVMEFIAAGTIFTTHTPVAAGHDVFTKAMMDEYFPDFAKKLGVSKSDFLALGATPHNQGGFNQTALALRCSRHHNGVSRIHGSVASETEGYIWPQVPSAENPITYVTNGVHVATFLAREWINLFDMHFGGDWRNQLVNDDFWQAVDTIPDHSYWSIRQSLKAKLLEAVYSRAVHQYYRNGCSQAKIERLTAHLLPQDSHTLVIGFARRFATYKRATLLFTDLERLSRIVNNPDCPVIFVFAGKAHPHDVPGQQLIKFIYEVSQRREFEGKIIFLEGYDLALGRRLVSGVDVWLNTPEYPMEASGTSGEKAGLNGVINLSVLDGWWGEGYDGENGWAIAPHTSQYDSDYSNQQEANELLDIIEEQVIPLYYYRNGHDYSEGWVKMSKASMKTLLPRFNALRMVSDYIRDHYIPASRKSILFQEQEFAHARELGEWKQTVVKTWPGVRIRRIDQVIDQIKVGATLPTEIGVYLNGLDVQDVIVECLVGTEGEHEEFIVHSCHKLEASGRNEAGETVFSLDLKPTLPGLQYYQFRVYPYHQLLTHHFETGCMLWV